MSIFRKIINGLKTWHFHRTHPLRLEFVVTDFCNLNCKGCGHYSPVAPQEFETLETITRQLKHISEADHKKLVKKLYIMGGEPLTAPVDTLTGMARQMRHYFPEAEVYLFTNGLALKKMPEVFWKSLKDNNVILAITRYPIKADYEAIEELVKKQGVRYNVFADRNMANSFFRFGLDPKGTQDKRMSHFRCFNFGCVTVRDGRIYPCSTSACISHLNNRFGTKFKHEPGDFLRIEDITDTRQILKLRNNPVPFCRYCRKPDTVKYGPSRREASEWVVD